jgi:hypothetical protein
MKTDKALVKHLLSILRRLGPAGLEETALMIELEVAAGRPLTTQEARDAILFAADRGWTLSRRDDFDRTIIWITDSGINTLAGM